MALGDVSSSDMNEYQEYLLGVKVAGAYGCQTYVCRLPRKFGSFNVLEP
jgi:hypothetical protein